MSDHDASPKEWTQAHSIRHGPQRYINKQQRAQLQAQQAYLASIVAAGGGKHPASMLLAGPHAHFAPYGSPLSAAAATSSRRRSSLEQQLELSLHDDGESEHAV